MYTHTVQYHETDMMGITHHSRYILWMEEARTLYLKNAGLDYGEMEKTGIICPTTGLSIKYRRPTTYEDEITIDLSVTAYTGVTATFAYKIMKADGTLCCEAESTHCFTNREGRPIAVKRENPRLDEKMRALLRENLDKETSE